MRFGVLGTLEVYDDSGAAVRLSGPVRRLLLAALVARAGRTVPVETLIDDLWGESPPPSAGKTLQGHMMRLRADIGRADAYQVLVTDPSGYRLAVGADAVDAGQFERDLQLGQSSLDADRPDEAVVHLDRAVSRWRDDAYLEFTEPAFAAGERQRLAELRSLAREERAEAALQLGQAAELVAELEIRVIDEPYREKGWEQLILALYLSGRQAEALAAYRRAAARLDEDLGVAPGAALAALHQRILQHDPSLFAGTVAASEPVRVRVTPAPVELRNPYRGLARYEESDSPLFVARERLTAELAGRLAEHDLIVLAGVSGVGKSSLVRAGLVPALRAGALPGSPAWRSVVLTPDGVLSPTAGRAVDLLVVDQAEELFTLIDSDGREAIARGLVSYLGSGGRVMLVVRADFYGALASLPGLGHRIGRSTVLVAPPTESDLRAIVTEPARRVGLSVEPELVEQVLDDVRDQPGALPLLSAALVRTYDNREEQTLTVAGYRAGGGVAAALEATAEEAFRSLDHQAQAAARILLVRLVIREGAGWVRRPMPRTELERISDEASQRAVAALAESRLVVVGAERVELAHEALLTGWPRLRGWLQERALAADLVEHLRTSALAWEQAGRPDADLYRGPRLQAALDWREHHRADVAPLESAFLDAGASVADAELAAANARADTEARARRRLRTVVVALAAAMAVVLAAGGLAVHERADADAAALSANAGRAAALSQTVPDVSTSLLLAAAGYRLQDSAATRSGLLAALQRTGSVLWRQPTANRLLSLFASSDGSRLYVADNQDIITVYSLPDRRIVATYPARANNMAALSPDGTRLAVEGPNGEGGDPDGAGRISILDTRNGARVKVLPTLASEAYTDFSGVFTGDGRWFAVMAAPNRDPGRPGSDVAVYDAANWATAPRVLHLPADVTAFATGTADLMVACADGTVRVVKAADLTTVSSAVLPEMRAPKYVGGAASSISVALAPDDQHAALAATYHGVNLLQPVDARHLGARGSVEIQQTAPDSLLRFSPDSSRIAAVSGLDTIVIYGSDGKLQQSLVGQNGQLNGLSWAGHGSSTALYSDGLDSQIVSWQVSDPDRLLRVGGPALSVPQPYHLQKVGDHVIGAPNTGPGKLSRQTLFDLDLRTGIEASWPLGFGSQDAVSQVSVDPHGHVAIVTVFNMAASDNRFQAWDLATHRLLGTFRPPPGADSGVQFPVAVAAADGRQAWETVAAHTVDLVAVPSGAVLRSVTMRFKRPDAAQLQDEPVVVDPAGRLLVAGEEGNPPPPPPLDTGPALPPPAASVAAPDLPVGVFDPHSGQLLGSTSMTAAGVNAWAYSPDGSTLAFGTTFGTVTVADAATLRPRTQNVAAASGYVNSVDYSPDGSMIITGSTDGSFTFWDAASMRPIAAPVATGRASSWAWFDPGGDARGLTTQTSADGTESTRVFTFPGRPQEWAATACAIAGADVTRQDWTRYISTTPYRHVCP